MEVKNILLGLLIAVIFLMFYVYGTKLVYNAPVHEKFCNVSYPYPEGISGKVCNTSLDLQMRVNNCYNAQGIPRYEYDSDGCGKNITCDFCNRDFERANKEYTKNLFLISLILGVITIIIPVVIIKISAVSGGLMLGSLLFIIYGTAGYWGFMEDFFRFIILGVVLFILIGLAYWLARRNMDKKKESKKKNRKRK